MLTPRQERILRKVVEDYLRTGQPVASRVDRGRSRARLRPLDGPQRAGAARGARAARPPARLRRARADRRRPPLRRRRHADSAGRAPRRADARAVADPPRGRRGDARDHRDALAGDEPARGRLGAVDQHRDDPPHRGARAAAAGRDGRDHHLHGRRLEDARDVRARRRSGPASRGPGEYLNERLVGLRARRADAPAAPASTRASRRSSCAFLDRLAPAFGELADGGRGRAVRRGHGAPVRGRPDRGRRPGQRADRAARAARRAAAGAARGARRAGRLRPHRPRERAARDALAGGRRDRLRARAAQARHGVGDRPGADGLRGRDRHRARGRRTSSRASSKTPTPRTEARAARCRTRSLRGARRRARRLRAGDQEGVPRARARAAPGRQRPRPRRPRRSSRRPPRPTRSSPTPSGGRPTTATATTACAPAATRRTSTASARSATSSTPSSAAAAAAGSARPQGGDVAVAVEIDLLEAAAGDDRRGLATRRSSAASTATATAPSRARRSRRASAAAAAASCRRSAGRCSARWSARWSATRCHGDGTRRPREPCKRVPRARARCRARASSRCRCPPGSPTGSDPGRRPGHAGEAGAPPGDLYVLVGVRVSKTRTHPLGVSCCPDVHLSRLVATAPRSIWQPPPPRAGGACRRPAMRGRKRCRLHGGLSPGAPRGFRNGNFKIGDWTTDAITERRWLRSLLQSFAT